MIFKLLILEIRKLRSYRPVWWLLGLHFGFLALILASLTSIFSQIEINGPELSLGNEIFYKFPDVWQNLAFAAKWFATFLAILVITSVSNEYSYRTNRQNIIDGLSRTQFITSKVALVFLLGIIGTVFLWLASTLLGLIYAGADHYFQNIEFLFAYFMSVIGLYSMALLFGVLIRKAALSILALLGYAFIVEPIMRSQLPGEITRFLPLKTMGNLIPQPYGRYIPIEIVETITHVEPLYLATTTAYIALFLFLAYRVEQTRDL